ncbi:MAG TPA: hypothetical protein VF744_12565 [Beijerinckiaceae bacterium]
MTHVGARGTGRNEAIEFKLPSGRLDLNQGTLGCRGVINFQVDGFLVSTQFRDAPPATPGENEVGQNLKILPSQLLDKPQKTCLQIVLGLSDRNDIRIGFIVQKPYEVALFPDFADRPPIAGELRQPTAYVSCREKTAANGMIRPSSYDLPVSRATRSSLTLVREVYFWLGKGPPEIPCLKRHPQAIPPKGVEVFDFSRVL